MSVNSKEIKNKLNELVNQNRQQNLNNKDLASEIYKMQIKDKLKTLTQIEIDELAIEHIPNYLTTSAKENEKLLVKYFLSQTENESFESVVKQIPEKPFPALNYFPRTDKFNNSTFEDDLQKQSFVIKKLATKLVDLSKNLDDEDVVEMSEKLKQDAILSGRWIPTAIYLQIAEEKLAENPEYHNADGSVDIEKRKKLIMPEWYYKKIKYINWDYRKDSFPTRSVQSEEKMKFLFLTEQQGASIEYLYANFAKAGQAKEFVKTFNLANWIFEKEKQEQVQNQELKKEGQNQIDDWDLDDLVDSKKADEVAIKNSEQKKEQKLTETKSVKLKMKM